MELVFKHDILVSLIIPAESVSLFAIEVFEQAELYRSLVHFVKSFIEFHGVNLFIIEDVKGNIAFFYCHSIERVLKGNGLLIVNLVFLINNITFGGFLVLLSIAVGLANFIVDLVLQIQIIYDLVYFFLEFLILNKHRGLIRKSLVNHLVRGHDFLQSLIISRVKPGVLSYWS